MKIAIFSDTYRPMINGVTVSLDNHSKNLVRKGHTVKVFTIRDKIKVEAPKDVKIHFSRGMDLPTYKGLRIAFPNSIDLFLSIKKFNPDVIHAMTPFGMGAQAVICSKLLNIPLVFTEHTLYVDFREHVSLKKAKGIKNKASFILGTFWGGQNSLLTIYSAFLVSYYKSLREIRFSRLITDREKLKIKNILNPQLKIIKGFRKLFTNIFKLKNLNKVAPWNLAGTLKGQSKEMYEKLIWRYFLNFYNQADLVSTPSPSMKKTLESKNIKPQVIAISNGIDLKKFQKINSKKNKKFTIINVGRVSYEKNIDISIKAVAKFAEHHEDVEFLIYGSGPEMKEMKTLIKELRMEEIIALKGPVENSDLPKFYSKGDVFITASTIETEGIVLLEAMACGLPIIAVNAMACPNVVKHEKNGFIASPSNFGEMAEYLEILYQDRSLLKKMEKNSLEFVSGYDLTNIINKWEKIYNELINKKRQISN